MTTIEPTKGEGEYGVKFNEPTTGELIEALRCDGVIKPCEGCFFAFQIENCSAMGCRTDDMFGLAADRLESQERELSGITGELEKFKAFHERYAEQTSKKYIDDICALTARAEQAEKEREAAVYALSVYEDALLDECDKSYQGGFMDGFRSKEEMDDED